MNTTLDFVLEGRVFMEERDQQGKLLAKTEVPGDVVLKILINVVGEEARRTLELEKEDNQFPFQFTYG